jgi:hypothetical protein
MIPIAFPTTGQDERLEIGIPDQLPAGIMIGSYLEW